MTWRGVPDTDVPESQGTQALDRYAYVNNSPVNFKDPTGHDFEQIIFNRTGTEPRSMWSPLPEPKDISTGVNFPAKPDGFTGTQGEYELAIKIKTLDFYKKYREWLIKNGLGHYIDGHGWIRDKALIALVINSEIAFVKNLDPKAYEAALSALSYQFSNNAYTFHGSPICGQACPDATAQLVWLQAFEGMRRDKPLSTVARGNEWTEFIPDALRILAGRFGDYFSWGNGGGGRLCTSFYSFCVR